MRELLELVAGRAGSGAYGDAVHRGRCQCRERFGIGSLAQLAPLVRQPETGREIRVQRLEPLGDDLPDLRILDPAMGR
jgi:hypothetical protein